ncbi:uncharacterized protein LOC131928141 [Physella acuta]|uniref:uncharacterized protein LOC131928141 n=1 Tax=Physella acuta TaxID=109671 RepID=UPI0027DD3CAA|nr:uncharacterized protein LOC131928141 [Physella acuta]
MTQLGVFYVSSAFIWNNLRITLEFYNLIDLIVLGMTFIIFLPDCVSDACNRSLSEVSATLRDVGCNVVTNKINGTYKKNLMEQFKSSTLTILHQCRDFWKQMRSNGVRLADELRPVEKLVCVRFSSIDTPLTVKEEILFAKFFLSFNVQAVHDAESLDGFVDKVKQCKDEWISRTRETTGSSKSDNFESELQNVEQEILQTLVRLKNEEELRHKDNGVCHVRYPEENSTTAQNYVFVLAPISSFNKSHLINYDTIKSLNELYKGLKELHRSPEIFEANIEFIYNKILPTFFKFKAIYGLAQIAAICKERQIQERCFLYLELLLLQKDELTCNYNNLQDVQLKLTKVMKYLRTEYPKGGDQFTNSSVKKLSQILVMVDVLKYLNHKRKGSSRSDENFRTKIKSLLTECNKVGECDVHITTALQFLMESPRKLQNAITKQISQKKEKLLANIWSSKKLSTLFLSSPKQIVCVIGFIKRLFSGTDSTRTELLDCCLKKITTSKVNVNPVVISMLKHGVVMFLTHGLKNISHQHSQEICDKGIMLLKSLSSKEPLDEMCHDLSVLLFSNVPTVRKGVIEIFYEFKIYNRCLKPFLVLEVINKLAPFLEINDEAMPKFIEKEHQEGWFTLCAEFNHKPARVIAHYPSTSVHHVDNHTEFGQGCAYKNELDLLKSLRHDNIIQLLAYHMRSIPQFYIIEAHANFQQMLRLKNWKRDYYSASLLHSFVIQAAVAVEHCHQSDIVVACITAKSFVVTDSGQLKLGDLRCAKKLNGLSEILIPTSSFIPIKWCAPETLKRLKISFKSDYWMFGCLMEEVLTHGAPPNSHTPCDDWTYVNNVYENTNQLYQEKCINDQHFEIIKMCVQHDPNQRLTISQAIYQLKQVDQERISIEQPSYPNLEKEKRVPKSDLKPVSELPTYCNLIHSSPMSVKDLSDTLKEYTMDNRVFVREFLKPCSLSAEVIDKIGKGVLDLILPKVDVITTPEGAMCIVKIMIN